jgi:hypothetical protein
MKEENVPIEKYRVMTVTEIAPPEGMTGMWHHYIIGEGLSRIDGKRPGTLQAVTQHAEAVAERLNLRAATGSFPTHISRSKKEK